MGGGGGEVGGSGGEGGGVEGVGRGTNVRTQSKYCACTLQALPVH